MAQSIMALYAVFYNSGSAQSLAAAWLLKYSSTYGGLIDWFDTKGKDAAGITTLIGTATPDAYTKVFLLVSNATAHAAGCFTNDQVASLDVLLIDANKGSAVGNLITTGAAASNSTVTNIVLASTGSAVDDFYNLRYVKTTGVTAVYKIITDYTGSSKTAVVTTTTTAISTGLVKP